MKLLEEEELSENSREFLGKIRDQMEKTDFLMQSMVKMSRLEAGILQIRKENKKLVRCRIIEKSFIVIVFIMYYIRTILRIRLTCFMVYDTETFSTFYYKLEINMLIMALAFTLR